MSQIAAALARSKGKKVEPVPSATSVVPSIHTSAPPMPPKAPPAKKEKFPVKIAVIAGGVVLLLGIGSWLFLRSEPPPPAPKRATPPPPPTKTVPAPAPATAATGLAADAEPAAPARMAPELEEQLRKLNITARRLGTDPRIVIGRKVFTPGDEVLPGAFLDGIQPDRVIFRDAENHRFERRF